MKLVTRRRIGRSYGSKANFRLRPGANDFSILNPTIWANEAIQQLPPKMILANLIHRDFSPLTVDFGDIVNAFVPGVFQFGRKGAACEPVVVQDATGSRVQVALNQWPQVAFRICDGEPGQSRLDLINSLVDPAVNALAQGIDRIVSGAAYQFLGNAYAGHLGLMDSTNIGDYLVDAKLAFDLLNVPEAGRTMILGPRAIAAGLKARMFSDVAQSGTNRALRDGIFDRAFGWDLTSASNGARAIAGQATSGALVNHAGGYSATSTSIVVDTGDTNLAAGAWITIAGDDTPQHVTASNMAGNASAGAGTLTISPGLRRAVADNAVVTNIKGGLVNLVAGYIGTTTGVIGYSKAIATDTWTAGSPPQIGQGLTFGVDTTIYTIIGITIVSSTEYNLLLDKPLVNAIADEATVNPLPSGEYNFGFQRNAFTMVNRPPRAVLPGVGALSKTVSDAVNKISLRVTISYDSSIQAHMCVIDTFMGIATLDTHLGMPMFG